MNTIFCSYAFSDTTDSVESGQSHVRVMHVQHTQGPVDGSLYATVNKKQQDQSGGGVLTTQQQQHVNK